MAVDHQLLVLRDVARGKSDVAQLIVISCAPSECIGRGIPGGVGVGGVLKGGIHFLSFVIVGLQVDVVDHYFSRSNSIIAREADFIALQDVLIEIIGSLSLKFVLDDELVDAFHSIKCKVRTAFIEKDTDAVASDEMAVDHQLLVLRDVARGKAYVAQLIVISCAPSERLG